MVFGARRSPRARNGRDVERPIDARRPWRSPRTVNFDRGSASLAGVSRAADAPSRARCSLTFSFCRAPYIGLVRRRRRLHAVQGVDGRLLPLVILTELGGGLLVLLGLKHACARDRPGGFCLFDRALRPPARIDVHFRTNIAMAGGFLLLATFGPGAGRSMPGGTRERAAGPGRQSKPPRRGPCQQHNVGLEGA